MAVKKFTYPLKGNNDVASIRTKELALEAFLNSLDLSTSPEDPGHNHNSAYAAIGHGHPGDAHSHDQYLLATEGVASPISPDIGDFWIKGSAGTVDEVYIWSSDGWVPLMGGGSGGAGGPHSRHPDSVTIYEASSDSNKWRMAYNAAQQSLDFDWIG
jgi:hypothetical protein